MRALLAPPVWQEGGSWAHILGTDDVGRCPLAPDVWRAFVTAGRLSAVVLSLVVMGIILGLSRAISAVCR